MSSNDFIFNNIKGKHVHIKCACLFKLDITGVITSYQMSNSEMVLTVTQDGTGKRIPVGLNTPKLYIEAV